MKPPASRDSRGHRLIFEFAQWLEMTPVSVTIKSVKWIVPAVQSVHIITIGIVFVSVLPMVMREKLSRTMGVWPNSQPAPAR